MCNILHFNMTHVYIQWNLSNLDTIGPDESVHLLRCPQIRSVLMERGSTLLYTQYGQNHLAWKSDKKGHSLSI